ncbi:P-loop containing nucleoside triphosphate hydrolase protein [Suillus bovinus]|uniref:P-loop containing nucleoside triphosphate hydrolase protein n=1 Tax=Suillus bovinus TaxID=48563 RepID=UPI001B85ECF1|nr:P-loop containing nucleoside triphosphate hydrolase protein [Suillus bovinus]KAG2146162.1 P-loop containing nucleoside triphosphate hydrolase protein [Suillus bovinus]
MTHTFFTLQQNVYKADHGPIPVEDVDENSISSLALQRIINSSPGASVGVAATYRPDCSLSSLAFATLTRVLVIHFFASNKQNPQQQQKKKKKGQEQQPAVSRGRILIQDQILCNIGIKLYGYRIDRIALALFRDFSLRINGAVDMLSVSTSDRRSLQAIMNALGGEVLLQKDNVKTLFAHREGDVASKDVALQAWAAIRAATFDDMTLRFAAIPRIDTDTMPDIHLSALAKISRDAEILESLKPTKVVNNVKADFSSKKGNVNLECTRFSTRIMRSKTQVIHIETLNGDQRSTITGRAGQINGKQAHINVQGAVNASGKVLSVTTIGKEDLTAAESVREDVVLKALQGTITLTEHPFFCSIWAPSLSIPWPPLNAPTASFVYYPNGQLNDSQYCAVERIISQADRDRLLLVQGPPGTGKTTVIAASVNSMINTGPVERTVWLVAQSNVAVKNIAEKLDKVGFRNFKLLVSKDFHYDWHEHLYERLEHCFIRSDLFGGGPVAVSRLLINEHTNEHTRVILCTLSMLSNPRIEEFTRQVPVQTVIFDEASQIEVGDYLPLLQRFQHSLQKMVFIGDDKQHRMPLVIGSFISRHVYGHKLLTVHGITSKNACRFLDVKRGQEQKAGKSWINQQEISVVIHLARIYNTQGKQFRILTPYDGQRSTIEHQLKLEKLPWEDKCFNVDSFQGNEEDHIIVSLVRTQGVGFLKNSRRTNVMLTRCKKSMIICTNRDFVTKGKAGGTLVGQLALTMGHDSWLDARDIVNGIIR